MKKITSALLMFMMVLSLIPGAFADQYRLKEEITGSERLVYDYDRSGTISCIIRYSEGELSEETDYYYRDAWTLDHTCLSFPDGEGIDGFTLCFHYDDMGTRIELENPGMGGDLYWTAQDRPRFLSDNAGRVVMVSVPRPDINLDQTWYYSYDSAGRISTFEITGFRIDSFTYYGSGEFTRTSTYLADNKTIVTERYDSAGRLVESTDQYGFVSRYVYDRNGMLSEKYTDGELEYRCRYDYDSNGNISRMTKSYSDAYSVSTEYRYERVK